SSGCLRAWERGTSTRVWVAGLATLPVTYCFSLCSWCDRMACSGVGSPSGSEASMLSLVGPDRRLSNKYPSERKCHHARLPSECASEANNLLGPRGMKPKHAIFLLSICGLSSITAEAVSETPSIAARSLYAVNESATDRGSISIYDIDAGHRLIKTVETVSHVGDVR